MRKTGAINFFRQAAGAFGPILLVGLPLVLVCWVYINRQVISATLSNDYERQQFITHAQTVLQDFLTLTLGILIEALPFVVLGVLISVIIQVFVPTQAIMKRLPRNGVLRRTIMSFLGIAMPVCECGNVPVARSLMVKGFSPQEAIIFLLAAPSVNIVTFVVTWEAFNFNHSVAIARVIATLVVANVVAYVVTQLIARDKLLTPEFAATCKADAHAPHSPARALGLFRSEMWLITRMLVVGALIAAASQTIVPRDVITTIGSNIALSVLAMLILAFVISICSSVDAFFALAYVGSFSLGSIVAFLVAGPMVDIKMIALMKTTFTYKALGLLAGTVLLLTFLIGMGLSYVW